MKGLLQLLVILLFVGAATAVGWVLLGVLGEDSRAEAQDHGERRTSGSTPDFVPPVVQGGEGAPNPAKDKGPSWVVLNNDAVDSLKAGDLETAIELLKRCVQGEPQNELFHRNLAEALTRLATECRTEGRLPSACLALLEEARVHAPDREDIASLADRWRREVEAEDGFREDASQNFHVVYDGGRTELLHGVPELLEFLDDAYHEFRLDFARDPVRESDQKIRVVLYRRAEFQSVTQLGDWAGGSFDGTIRVPIEDLRRQLGGLERTLRHELIHAFVHAVGGTNVPGWLNEGLAQWREAPPASLVAQARRRLESHALFDLETLQEPPAAWTDTDKILRAYAQAIALCDFIAYHYGDQVLYRMVIACGKGSTPAASFESATRVTLTTVLEDLATDLR